MSADIRAALMRLVRVADGYAHGRNWSRGALLDAIAVARAALAEPVGEGPSAADLLPVNPPNIPTTMTMAYRSAWREGVEEGWNEARDELKRRLDFQYMKLCKLEQSITPKTHD
jgi:hypothetical protein